MPTEISGIKIQADTTDGRLSSIPKNVQFSIWDATDPIIDTAYFSFPIENYVLFSHGTQSYNEVVHLGSIDDTPIGPNFFHNYGEDFGGYEGEHNILSWTDGEVVAFWPDERNKCGIKIKGPSNIYWEFLHLDSVAPGVAVGSILNKGDLIGKLGKTGPSGNFAHLHLGLLDYDTIWREIRYINLYPWIVSIYEAQFGKNLYAVARPHKIGMVGETITFDGTKSLAFNSTVQSYKWTFDDGLEIKAATAKRTFDLPGCYSAVLKITDNRGNEDIDFCTVTIFNSDVLDSMKFIPRIYMTYFPTMNIRAGENIRFRCWVQGKSGSLSKTKFNLDFGDGTILNDCNSYAAINHSFQKEGIHIVKAYATINGLDITQRIKVVIPQTGTIHPLLPTNLL
jgi:murein DD-endopeptidase MepM/ murein hydrolase activator NlpD